MNIIYINHYAGSPEMGMEFRPYYLAREWVKMGHKVIIIAGDYSHLRIKNPKVDKDFESQFIDGIEYLWIKTGTYEGNGVSRALTMFRFVHKIRSKAGYLAKQYKPDVVITSSTYPLDTFAGQKIRKKSGAKLIHEVHDMWPITLIELGGMKRSNPFVQLMQIGENSFCKNSDAIVSLLCNSKDYFIEHGMRPEKFHVVMNGIVADEWSNPVDLPEEHKDTINSLHDEGKFIICFFGSVTRSYAVDYLIDAVKKLDDDRVSVLVVGDGNQKNSLMEKAKGLDSVVFVPKIKKSMIPSLLESSDCCYVGALRNDMFRFGICMNKLFDSMMSGKPILYAVDAPNNFIKDYSCGISVEAENADALADGIKQLLSLSPEERFQMGKSGRDAVLNYFTYEKLAAQFAEVF